MHVLWLIEVEVLIKPYFEINFRSGLVHLRGERNGGKDEETDCAHASVLVSVCFYIKLFVFEVTFFPPRISSQWTENPSVITSNLNDENHVGSTYVVPSVRYISIRTNTSFSQEAFAGMGCFSSLRLGLSPLNAG